MTTMVNDTYPFSTANCTRTNNDPINWTTDKTNENIEFISTATE